jgi:hypothetical protein
VQVLCSGRTWQAAEDLVKADPGALAALDTATGAGELVLGHALAAAMPPATNVLSVAATKCCAGNDPNFDLEGRSLGRFKLKGVAEEIEIFHVG